MECAQPDSLDSPEASRALTIITVGLEKYPGCVNVSFAYVEGECLLMALKDIALSSGSACTLASLELLYVLRALSNSDESAHSSIRLGVGRFTTDAEIDYVLKAVQERVTFLRE